MKKRDNVSIISAIISAAAIIIAAALPVFLSSDLDNEIVTLNNKIAELEVENQNLKDIIGDLQYKFSELENVPKDSVILSWNGHQYMLYDKSCTWTDAKRYCELMDGHLVTITSQEEQNFIENNLIIAGTKGVYWLGGSDAEVEGQWKWVTGEDWGYANWHSAEPNNKSIDGGTENYLAMYHYDASSTYYDEYNGKWNDSQDDGTPPFSNYIGVLSNSGYICEWDSIIIG